VVTAAEERGPVITKVNNTIALYAKKVMVMEIQ
jgi:hypothetical protein